MSRKTPITCQSPWVAQIDSVERKLMHFSGASVTSGHPDASAPPPFCAGWFRCHAKYWIGRLTQLSQALQTSTVTGKQRSEYEECQQLLQQSRPALQRLHQRASAPSANVNCDQQEEAVTVALRAASKQRASQTKVR